MSVKSDKKELATNKLLEILRGEEVEDVSSGTEVPGSGKQKSAMDSVEQKLGLSAEEEKALAESPSDEEAVESASAKKSATDILTKIYSTLLAKTKSIVNPQRGSIGLDIGSDSVKYVVVEESKNKVLLKDFGSVKITATPDADAKARNESIKNAINSVIGAEDKKANDFSIAIFGNNVSIKKINLPQLPKNEITDAIVWNAKKDLPFSGENALFEHVILGPTIEKGLEKTEVLVAAADIDLINEQIDFYKELDIEPAKFLPVSLSIYQTFLKYHDDEKPSGVIVDVGAKDSNIIFINDGNLQFAREIGIGGDDITEGLIGTLSTLEGVVNIDAKEAERLKFAYGIPLVESTELTDTGVSLNQIDSLIRPSLERLLVQIQRSFDYYRSKFTFSDPEKVYVTGGTALMKNFAKYLSDGLDKPVEVLNPLKNVVVDTALESEKKVSSYAPALTVAMGNVFSKKKGINLLPKELKLKPLYAMQKRALIAAASVSLFFMILFSSFVVMEKGDITERRDFLDGRLLDNAAVQERASLQRQINTIKTDRANEEASISAIKGNTELIDYLKLISVVTPGHITLESLSILSIGGSEAFEVKVTGKLLNSADAYTDLAFYNNRLKRSGYFTSVGSYEILDDEISTAIAMDGKFVVFQITCQI